MGGCFNIFFFLSNMGRIFFSLFFSCFQEWIFRFKKYCFLLFREEKENIFSYYSLEGGGAFEIYEIFFFFFPPEEEKEYFFLLLFSGEEGWDILT